MRAADGNWLRHRDSAREARAPKRDRRAQPLPVLEHVGVLVLEVALCEYRLAQLVDEGGRRAREELEDQRAEQHVDGPRREPDDGQIDPEALLDARPHQLDGHAPAVDEGRLVDLSDAC